VTFFDKVPDISLDAVSAGFGITGAVEKASGFPAAAAFENDVCGGRIRKCALK
jgi:hypothetical protein